MVLYQPDLAGSNLIKDINKYSEIIKYINNNDTKDYSGKTSNDYGYIKNGNKKQ